MKKPVVMMDCDGVFANWVGAFCALAKRMWESGELMDCAGDVDPVFYESYVGIKDYHSEKWPGWSDKMQAKVWDVVNHQYNWFAKIPPIDATRENIKAMQILSEETQLYIVTARHQATGLPINMLTSMWLEEYFKIRANVIACNGHEKKVSIVKALGANYAFDDSPRVLADMLDECHGALIVARDYAYNRGANCPEVLPATMPRVRSVADFAAIVMRSADNREAA